MSEYTQAFDRILFEKSSFRLSLWLLFGSSVLLGVGSLVWPPFELGTATFILGGGGLLVIATVMTTRDVKGGVAVLYFAVALMAVLAIGEAISATSARRDEDAAYAAEDRQSVQLRRDLEALCTQAGGASLDDRACFNLNAVLWNFGEAGRLEDGLPPRPIE
jgi:hypothetical protein